MTMAVGLGKTGSGQDVVFEFPQVHRDAILRVSFHRTLRIPDDGRVYGLPPSLGTFPLKSVDDLRKDRIPAHWSRRGGVVLPMWQSEAMWLSFEVPRGYPFAVMIAAGKINAVDGNAWSETLVFGREQNFVEAPRQPWLDGFRAAEKGTIRQFVAMPLGAGYTVEEQITGKAEHGGVQILVRPIKAEIWKRRMEEFARRPARCSSSNRVSDLFLCETLACDMGLGQGGSMRQEIYESDEKPQDWDQTVSSKCFVAIANSLMWQALAGEAPPTLPPTAADYTSHGLPWFEYYADAPALEGSPAFAKVKSVKEMAAQTSEKVLPENESFEPNEAKTIVIPETLSTAGAKPWKTGAF
jgi:hypothetical protein